MWHDSLMHCMTHLRVMNHSCVTSLINVWDSYVTWLFHARYDSFTCDMAHSRVTWLIHQRHDSLILVPWRSHACLLLHAWHDSFICDMTHSDMHADACATVTWLTRTWHDSYMCHVTYSCMTPLILVWHDLTWRHDSFVCAMTHPCVTRLIHLWHDSFKWHKSFIYACICAAIYMHEKSPTRH